MGKRITALKDVLWAGGIALALFFLLVGFLFSIFGHYYGDKTRPVMDISNRSEKPVSSNVEELAAGTVADGKLHELKATGDAGQSYLDSLTFLCDSSFIGLRDSALTAGQVWSSETGELSMESCGSWRIRYPGDDSLVSPANAAMVVKPRVLVIAVGSDGLDAVTQDSFIASYERMIQSILSTSPSTYVVCTSLCSVTAAFPSSSAMSGELAAEVNGWIRQVCLDTGAYYADLTSTLTDGGYLRSEYANADGRSLNNAGLSAVLGYLKTHSVTGQ